MGLIVEDGTIIVDANSFCTLAEIRAYGADRGIVFGNDASLTIFAIMATDYLISRQDEFVGSVVSPDQDLPWPRQNVAKSDGSLFATNSIPKALKNAQSQLCIEQFNGVTILPTINPFETGGFVVHEKVDVLETEFSEKIQTTKQPRMPSVELWLKSLIRPTGFGLPVIHV